MAARGSTFQVGQTLRNVLCAELRAALAGLAGCGNGCVGIVVLVETLVEGESDEETGVHVAHVGGLAEVGVAQRAVLGNVVETFIVDLDVRGKGERERREEKGERRKEEQ